jgi:hypothetical protein
MELTLKRDLSTNEVELEVPLQLLAQCQVGGYLDRGLRRYKIRSVDKAAGTLRAILCVTDPLV